MKIIHCADIHLDSPFSNMPVEKAAKRREELLLAMRRMVDYAQSNGIHHIIIAGDLFDKKKPSVTAKNYVIGLIKGSPDITFYYLRGNHDSNELFRESGSIPDNLKLFGDEWTKYIITDNADGYNSPKLVICAREREENAISDYSLSLDLRNFNIVIMHGEAGDGSRNINLKNLRNKGIDYLALGHIHSFYSEKIDNRGILCYPGCLESRGFDECGEHGFTVLDINIADRDMKLERVDLSIRNMCRLEVDISDCLNEGEILEKSKRIVESNVFSADDMFLLELTGTTGIENDINIHLLEQYFSNNYYLVRVHDSSEFRIDIEDYRLDESLKGEFVRMVTSDETLSETDKAKIIRVGIRALRGEVWS